MTRVAVFRGFAAVFAAVAIAYGLAYIYYARVQTASAELGFSSRYSEEARAAVVISVDADGPAAHAGLRGGDRIIAANGFRLSTFERFNRWDHDPAENAVVFTVQRAGRQPISLIATARRSDTAPISLRGILETSLIEILALFPVVFLTVGLTVLFLRPTDRFAWLMAAIFASLLSAPGFPRAMSGLPVNLAHFIRAYNAIALPALPALFYAFFARFPARSPMDRKLPWLIWVNLIGWAIFAVPNLSTGAPSNSPEFLQRLVGDVVADRMRLGYLLAGIPLGIMALLWNVKGAPTADARRKARVLLWGTGVGVLPVVTTGIVWRAFAQDVPAWWYQVTLVMLFWFPLSFAYAVVMHRVLDVPVLLRRSARYVLVRRGFTVLLAMLGITATAIFTFFFTELFDVEVPIATAVGVGFGMVLVTSTAPLVRKATTRIDRAFFRAAYNATAILENLAETIPRVTSRQDLAALLEREITQALHPKGVVIYLEEADQHLYARVARWHRDTPPMPLNHPLLVEIAKRGKPWDVSASSTEEMATLLRDSQAECIVPILGKGGRLRGVINVGASPSEQPYSGSDKRLLLAVANQAGIAFENIALAEEMAERLSAERAVAREIEIARQVQFRLFPQKQPTLRTLDYAGGCVQAQHVGGDYYDFVDIGTGRVGLVVADISGKGIAGALLMANLQASLRGQYGTAAGDLTRLLTSVNKLFYDNTDDNQYATLFFAEYSDATRRLHFANCGHFPPLLVRANGDVEQLHATAMVLGLFERWSVTTWDRDLQPGDMLVIYTDGVIEARNQQDEEFGISRLEEMVRATRQQAASDIVVAVQTAVKEFAGGLPGDDITVVVAKVL